MRRICDSSPSKMSKTKITLTVDELFSDILNRMNISKEDISSFQGEDSDKITETFEDRCEFEDIFDMDKFRFISESIMARKKFQGFFEIC